MLAVLGATLVWLAVLAVVGATVRAWLAPVVRLPEGIGVTAGIGMAVIAVPVAVAFAAGLDAVLCGVVLLALAVLAGAVRLALSARGLDRGSGARALVVDVVTLAARRFAVTRLDAMVLGAVLVATWPLARHGLTYWTTYVNDFPSYAASVHVWQSGPDGGAAFLDRHPDAYGTYHLWRATTVKPLLTAVLAVLSRVSGVPGEQMLAPATIVLLVVLGSTLVAVTTRIVPGPRWVVAAATLVPVLSITPMGRVLDAQLGQSASAALVAVTLALVVADWLPRGRPAAVVLLALVVAAALGSNMTLVAGAAPALVAVVLAVWARRPRELRPSLVVLVLGVVGAAAASVPFVRGYLDVSAVESGGTGYELPFPSPLSLLAMHGSIHDVTPLWWWALGVPALAVLVVLGAPGRGRWWGLAAWLVTVANGAVFLVLYGTQSYHAHKYAAFVIAVVAPWVVALAAGAAASAGRRRETARVLAATATGCLLAVSVTNAAQAAKATPVVVPPDMWALRDDPRIAAIDTLDVRVADIYQSPLAVLVVPSAHVVNTELSYAPSHPPEGDWALIHRDWWDLGPISESVDVGETYELVRFELPTLEAGVWTPADAEHQGTENFLYGRWRQDQAGTFLAAGDDAWVAFSMPEQLAGQDVDLVLEGGFGTSDGSALVATLDGEATPLETSAAPGTNVRRAYAALRVTVPATAWSVEHPRVSLRLAPADAQSQIDLRLDRLGLWP